MSSFHEDPTPRDLDAYLDGTLPEHARKSLAREIEGDRELRADLELQRRIDSSLRRAFVPPSLPAALLSQLQPPAPPKTFSRPRLGSRALTVSAAVAAVVIAWGYVAWQFIPHAPRAVHRQHEPQTNTLATVYQQRIDEGFQPDVAMTDEKAFTSAFASRQGQGLALRPLPEGSQVLGLAFSGGCSARTTAIMAQVDKSPVMVFVDRLEADNHPEVPAVCVGLRMYRKELGSLVAYELSPFDKPRVIDQLYTVGSATPRMGPNQ